MRYLVVFHDGSKREITGEDGKYWLTGETKIRKLSNQIQRIETVEEEAETVPEDRASEKKKARKKKTEE